eukprot:1444294-Ditylum_brightwellii.AAC.1
MHSRSKTHFILQPKMKHSQTALMGKYQRDHAPTQIDLTNMNLTQPLNMIINNQRLAEINLKT